MASESVRLACLIKVKEVTAMRKSDMARQIIIHFTPEDVNHAFTLEVFSESKSHSKKYYFDRAEIAQEIEAIGLNLEQGMIKSVVVCPPAE